MLNQIKYRLNVASTFKLVGLLLIPLLHFSLGNANEQFVEIPTIACPDYFQYVILRDGQFGGKLKLSNLKLDSTEVELQFSQRVPLESDYTGTISHIQSEAEVSNNKEIGIRKTFSVGFPVKNAIPKLTKILVNKEQICNATDYDPPSTSFRIQHTFNGAAPTLESPNGSEATSGYAPEPGLNPRAAQPEAIPVIQPFKSPTIILPEGICGHQGPDHSQGSILKRGEYPWLVAIYKKELPDFTFINGGSLISARTIVTSAQNFQKNHLVAIDISVSLGRYNLSDPLEDGVINRDIETLHIHPDYKPGLPRSDADIALLVLVGPVRFTQFIRPICLYNSDTEESIVGKSAIVFGWNVIDEYETPVILPKKAHADVVSQETCLRSSPAFYALTSTRTLCAGKRDDTGPCGGGDSLMVNRDGIWALCGIASSGLAKGNKCDLSHYVVYSDIWKHKLWIDNYIK